MQNATPSITNTGRALVFDGLTFPSEVRVVSDRPTTFRDCTFEGRLVLGSATADR